MPRCLSGLVCLTLLGACAADSGQAVAALEAAVASARQGGYPPRPPSQADGPPAPVAARPRADLPGRPDTRPETPVAADLPPPRAAQDLLGLAPATVRRTLGPPALRRDEGTAEIWLYVGPGCALDLVLYTAGGATQVGYAAARALGPAAVTEPACLSAIAGAAVPGRAADQAPARPLSG